MADSIRSLVYDKTGDQISGPIRLLTHFRYFGYVFNPLSVYFCYDQAGENVTHVVAEVMNTPWKEQHCYVLTNIEKNNTITSIHQKEFHVSPFLNMDMEYRWNIQSPGDQINIHIENWAKNNKVFDASIFLHQTELNTRNLRNVLINFPLMTLKVTTMIHFEALKLWLKGIQFIPHPKHQ